MDMKSIDREYHKAAAFDHLRQAYPGACEAAIDHVMNNSRTVYPDLIAELARAWLASGPD